MSALSRIAEDDRPLWAISGREHVKCTKAWCFAAMGSPTCLRSIVVSPCCVGPSPVNQQGAAHPLLARADDSSSAYTIPAAAGTRAAMMVPELSHGGGTSNTLAIS